MTTRKANLSVNESNKQTAEANVILWRKIPSDEISHISIHDKPHLIKYPLEPPQGKTLLVYSEKHMTAKVIMCEGDHKFTAT